MLEPGHSTEFIKYRVIEAIVIAICGLIIWVVPAHTLWSSVIPVVGACSIQVMIAVIMCRATSGYTSYLLGYTCTIYAVALCVRAHWVFSAFVVGASMVIIAVVPMLMRPPWTMINAIMTVFFIGTAGILSMIGHVLRYRTSLDEFYARVTAEEAHDKNIELVAQLEYLSSHDPLTGVANRRALDDALARELEQAQRNETHLGLVLMDIDHFKELNDTFGHQEGDQVLRQVGLALLERTRGFTVARYGGEEFVVLLPAVSPEQIAAVADDIRVHVGLQAATATTNTVTLSAGVSVFPAHAGCVGSLLGAADRALYQAKAQGRNCTVLFSDSSGADSDVPHGRSVPEQRIFSGTAVTDPTQQIMGELPAASARIKGERHSFQ